MKNQKKLIILTGPSGVGKGTVVKEILGKEKNFWLSISATTREPREGERDGENYYFLNQEKFKEMIEQNLFLEWAQFAGNYYGTPLSSVNEKIEKAGKMNCTRISKSEKLYEFIIYLSIRVSSWPQNVKFNLKN